MIWQTDMSVPFPIAPRSVMVNPSTMKLHENILDNHHSQPQIVFVATIPEISLRLRPQVTPYSWQPPLWSLFSLLAPVSSPAPTLRHAASLVMLS